MLSIMQCSSLLIHSYQEALWSISTLRCMGKLRHHPADVFVSTITFYLTPSPYMHRNAAIHGAAGANSEAAIGTEQRTACSLTLQQESRSIKYRRIFAMSVMPCLNNAGTRVTNGFTASILVPLSLYYRNAHQ